jgi:hypothetical protein
MKFMLLIENMAKEVKLRAIERFIRIILMERASRRDSVKIL